MTFPKALKPVFILLGWVVAFLTISFFIGEVTRENMGWYDTLEKSPLNPPRIAFPIVWTTLYIMLAIVGANLWQQKSGRNGHKHLIFFSLYMMINWAWSFIFFSLHLIDLGFAWILLSDFVLVFLIYSLMKDGRNLWAYLLCPTLLWGGFAAYLNGYIALIS